MPSLTLLGNLRFRKTPISADTLTAEVVCPVRKGSKGDHTFLSYWDARATREEADKAAAARPDSRHPVVGYATISVAVIGLDALEPAAEPAAKLIPITVDDEVAATVNSLREGDESASDVIRRLLKMPPAGEEEVDPELVAIAEAEGDVEQPARPGEEVIS